MDKLTLSDLNTTFVFYKMPKDLILNEDFKEMSPYAKILYSLYLDRTKLSFKNGFEDDEGVYIYFTIEEVMKIFNCSKNKAIKSKKELLEYGLISEKRQFDKPNKIYVKKIKYKQNSVKEINCVSSRCKPQISLNDEPLLSLNGGLTEVDEMRTIKNDNIKNDNIKNDIYSSSNNIYIESQKTTTDATADNSLKNLFDYYQKRIGLIDSFQYQMILEYVKEDGMAIEIIEKAIGKAADNGKRNFNYVNSILKNWKQNGITTLAQVESEERSFSRKVKNNKHGSDHSGIYDPSDVDLLF